MTRIYLTDEDYAVIDAGDKNEMKRHFNDLRGELTELKSSVKDAVAALEPAVRLCKLRRITEEKEPQNETEPSLF